MVQLVTESQEPGQESSPIEENPSGTLADFALEKENLESRLGTVSNKHVNLHEHRMKDELEEYRQRMAGTD